VEKIENFLSQLIVEVPFFLLSLLLNIASESLLYDSQLRDERERMQRGGFIDEV
jgi:hypothetical protein